MEIVSAILQNLALAQTMAGLLINERDREKAAAIKIELTEKILGAQAQLAQVLAAVIEKDSAIHRLSERNRDLEAAQREKERYRLAKLGTVGEVFAYQLRPSAELVERTDEPPHFVCQPCFDAGKKGVLRLGQYAANCPLCNSFVDTHKPPARNGRAWMDR